MSAKKAAEVKPVPFVLLTVADTEKLIGQIGKAGQKLDANIQTALQCVAIHAHQHGDITLAQKLVESLLIALPKGLRSNAVKAWLVQYAPVAFTNGKLVYQRPYEAKDDAARQAAIQACETAELWTAFKPEPAFVPFDMQDSLAKLLKRAETALIDPDHKHKVSPEQVADLRRLMASLAA